MSYFAKFPLMVYEQDGSESVVQDILRRSMFISEYKQYTDLYSTHTIVDGDTPQSLAYRVYGAATYHWVILMFNELHNPYFEWPLNPLSLRNLCVARYGEDQMYLVKHYEDEGNVVGEIKEFVKEFPWVAPPSIPFTVPISFYDYEEALNDSRRVIHILRPELLGEFVKQFGASLKNV